jgi:trimethylamine:corrinoid methyltransferase-like protein
VTEDHTIAHMMDEFFLPELSVRCNFDIWEERGRPDMLSRANELVQKILQEGKEGLLDPDMTREIKRLFPAIQKDLT